MTYVIGFAPWIAYWTLAGFAGFKWAIIGAFAGAVIINFRALGRHGLKVLELGTLTFFTIMVVLVIFFDLTRLGLWMPVLGSLALALIALVSILIRRPFTLQYARESVAREYWDHPLFYSINYRITSVWLACFLVHVPSGLGVVFYPDRKLWFLLIIPLVSFLAAIRFTLWYPDFAKAKYFQKIGFTPQN